MGSVITQNKSYSYDKEFYQQADSKEAVVNDVDFSNILQNTLSHEGDYTVDVGGPTNQGITQKSYDLYSANKGLKNKSVKDVLPDEVNKFYYDEFYKAPKIDQLPYPKVKGVLFDYAVNSGTGRAVKELQKELGVEVDGNIGLQTLNALDKYITKYGENFLAHQILNRRANFYQKLVEKNPEKYSKYLTGWTNRISSLKEQYQLNG
jgi:lysozyme family protein